MFIREVFSDSIKQKKLQFTDCNLTEKKEQEKKKMATYQPSGNLVMKSETEPIFFRPYHMLNKLSVALLTTVLPHIDRCYIIAQSDVHVT